MALVLDSGRLHDVIPMREVAQDEEADQLMRKFLSVRTKAVYNMQSCAEVFMKILRHASISACCVCEYEKDILKLGIHDCASVRDEKFQGISGTVHAGCSWTLCPMQFPGRVRCLSECCCLTLAKTLPPQVLYRINLILHFLTHPYALSCSPSSFAAGELHQDDYIVRIPRKGCLSWVPMIVSRNLSRNAQRGMLQHIEAYRNFASVNAGDIFLLPHCRYLDRTCCKWIQV